MQAVIKNKLRYPRHMNNEVLYAHEHAGRVGLDHIQTLVNTNRLMLLVNCLSQGGQMERILIGAVQRFKEYVGTASCPLQHKVTEYTTPSVDGERQILRSGGILARWRNKESCICAQKNKDDRTYGNG
jgi:hypothetical protein